MGMETWTLVVMILHLPATFSGRAQDNGRCHCPSRRLRHSHGHAREPLAQAQRSTSDREMSGRARDGMLTVYRTIPRMPLSLGETLCRFPDFIDPGLFWNLNIKTTKTYQKLHVSLSHGLRCRSCW
jgi:hypothetical protein